jgi:hypothetical protein
MCGLPWQAVLVLVGGQACRVVHSMDSLEPWRCQWYHTAGQVLMVRQAWLLGCGSMHSS